MATGIGVPPNTNPIRVEDKSGLFVAEVDDAFSGC